MADQRLAAHVGQASACQQDFHHGLTPSLFTSIVIRSREPAGTHVLAPADLFSERSEVAGSLLRCQDLFLGQQVIDDGLEHGTLALPNLGQLGLEGVGIPILTSDHIDQLGMEFEHISPYVLNSLEQLLLGGFQLDALLPGQIQLFVYRLGLLAESSERVAGDESDIENHGEYDSYSRDLAFHRTFLIQTSAMGPPDETDSHSTPPAAARGEGAEPAPAINPR